MLTALGILFCWNLFNVLFAQSYISLLPLGIQAVVLYLILTKDKYAKQGIMVWSAILIIGSGLFILGKTFTMVMGAEEDMVGMIGPMVLKIVFLTIGLLVYHYNDTTVELEFIQKDKTIPPQP
ncbi:MAG: hypothetical protein R2819_14075 [Allomuricauda sp.]